VNCGREEQVHTLRCPVGKPCLQVVCKFLGKVVVALDARIRLQGEWRLLVIAYPVVANADLDRPAHPALAQRRAIDGPEKLVSKAVCHAKCSDAKAVEPEEVLGAVAYRMYRLAEAVRERNVPTSLCDAARRWNIDDAVIIRLVALVEVIRLSSSSSAVVSLPPAGLARGLIAGRGIGAFDGFLQSIDNGAVRR
jgi:hypothetical protein